MTYMISDVSVCVCVCVSFRIPVLAIEDANAVCGCMNIHVLSQTKMVLYILITLPVFTLLLFFSANT